MEDKLRPLTIAVIALLKPSQVTYKITPIVNSDLVNEVILFRKRQFDNTLPKLTQIVLPKFMSIKPFYWTLTPFFIAWKLRKKKIDLLITYRFIPHTYYTYVVSKLLNIPFIYSQIDMDVVSLFNNFFGKAFILHVLNRAHQINVPGHKSQNYWSRFLYQKINVLHSTIDTDTFKPIQMQSKYDILYIGVLSKLKQVHLLIEMVSYLNSSESKVTMAVVGDGPQMMYLQNMIKVMQLEKEVHMLGHQIITPELICSSKIFVMASSSEGLPCALMEAMACELLCVVPNVGDIAEVIRPSETGVLFNNFNPQEMANQMKSIITDYENLILLRKNARKVIIDEHSFTSATQKWNSIFQEYLTND